jgi:acetolactate synthase-1/2/3 large subunit
MHKLTPNRTAAAALVEQLVINGVEHVFCVPGESYLPVLDALRDSSITITVCRHEGGAAMMAEAIGKVTGRPGICFVTPPARPMLRRASILPSRIRRR